MGEVVHQRYTYIGAETVIETTVGVDFGRHKVGVETNVLPLAPKRPSAPEPATEPAAAPPPSVGPGDVVAPSGVDSQPAHVAVEDPPAAPDTPERPQEAVCGVPAALQVSAGAEAPLTPRRRTLMGTIRAAWFVLFSVVGEALTYFLNNMTSLDLPPGTATAIGAVGYGLKRGIWPDTPL